MSATFDTLPGPASGRAIQHGIIATTATSFSDRIMVKLPGFLETLQFGPAKWQPRDGHTLPSRGDTCLVVFDDAHEPWIIVWWPKVMPGLQTPLGLPSYTLASRPAASAQPRTLIYVSDAASGQKLQYSDGSSWVVAG